VKLKNDPDAKPRLEAMPNTNDDVAGWFPQQELARCRHGPVRGNGAGEAQQGSGGKAVGGKYPDGQRGGAWVGLQDRAKEGIT
jgi:hypothetical protein